MSRRVTYALSEARESIRRRKELKTADHQLKRKKNSHAKRSVSEDGNENEETQASI